MFYQTSQIVPRPNDTKPPATSSDGKTDEVPRWTRVVVGAMVIAVVVAMILVAIRIESL